MYHPRNGSLYDAMFVVRVVIEVLNIVRMGLMKVGGEGCLAVSGYS